MKRKFDYVMPESIRNTQQQVKFCMLNECVVMCFGVQCYGMFLQDPEKKGLFNDARILNNRPRVFGNENGGVFEDLKHIS